MDTIAEVFTDQNFLGAIIASVVFILIGFILRRTNVIKESGRSAVNALVMWVAVPCMAFCAFMSDFDPDAFSGHLIIFILDILIYVLGFIIANLIMLKSPHRKIYAILMNIGQLTFFSIPLLSAIYHDSPSILIPGSLMSLPFRFFTYFYSYLVISGTKITKDTFGKTMKSIFLTPIMILMFLGLIIWLTQNVTFKVQVGERTYGFMRIDKTLPALYKIFQFGNVMATPLCMLLIGITLGEADFLEAIKNLKAWVIALVRTLVIPLCIFGIIMLIKATGLYNFDQYQTAVMVIGNAAPVGAIVSAYCVNYNKEGYLSSDCVFLSTVLCIITIPLLLVIVKMGVPLA